MTPPSQIEKTWLSHVRHELRTPVNIILGYSEIVLEDFASPVSLVNISAVNGFSANTESATAQASFLSNQQAIADLKTIHNCGQQILSLVNTLSDSNYVEFTEHQIDVSHIRLKFHAPIHTILNRLNTLLESEGLTSSYADLEKIKEATTNLSRNINRIIDFSVHQPRYQQTTEPLTLNGTTIDPLMVEEAAKTMVALTDSADKEPKHSIIRRFDVLIVDDKEANRNLLSRRLKRQGYRVSMVADGRQALELLEAQNCDLLLLDILMPAMNGYELLSQLKQHELWCDIPVIMIAALNEIDSVVKCIELGAEDYVTKPFNPILLQARISACLEKKYLRDQERHYLKQLAQAHAEILRKNHQLEQMANLDGLTQVANRRHFDAQIRSEWQRLQAEQQPLSLIFLDVDYFKRYNDYYGHLSGDDCLRTIAQTIAQTITQVTSQPNRLVARYGGEEFAILLPHLPLAVAQSIAETICQAVRNLAIAHQPSDVGDSVTASLGVASLIPQVIQSPDVLMDLADRALYRAKHQGRNQVCCLTAESAVLKH